ncbi:Protein DDI1 like protein 1 [Dictyocoela roeselum]|nr:Protein DDI1 like protein 1 [Dictyocoela roeselum]
MKQKKDKNKNFLICENKNNIKLIYIPVKINEQNMVCLIDTGAIDNFISENLSKKLNIPTSDLREKKIIETANGENVEIKEKALLIFQISGDSDKIYKATFFVLPKSSSDVILGSSFLIRNKAVIDLHKGSIRIDNSEYELDIFEEGMGEIDDNKIMKTKICRASEKDEQVNKFIKPYITKKSRIMRYKKL